MRRSRQAFHDTLLAGGFRDALAARTADALQRCDAALDAAGASHAGRTAVWVPGRIEVFGKHTDYAGGRSLLAAVERGFAVRAAPRDDGEVRIGDPVTGMRCETVLGASGTAPDGDWSHYVLTVVRRLALNFPEATRGADIAFVSDLPLAAGVSSSTALMISVFLSLAAVNRLDTTTVWQQHLSSRLDRAGYLGAMEMGGPYRGLAGLDGVGTLGGSQDQTAILCAQPDHVAQFSWMPVRFDGVVALPRTHCFVVASSGVLAEKTGSARDEYNRVSLLARHLLATWNHVSVRDDPSLAAAMDSGPGAPAALRAMIPAHATPDFDAAALERRLAQFLLETYALIPAATVALQAQDWATFGEVTAASMRGATALLGNQVAETIALCALARAHGAVAASAFGAGFGGSVWALVEADGAEAFRDTWAATYRRQFPAAGALAMFFTTAAGPCATQWDDDDPDP